MNYDSKQFDDKQLEQALGGMLRPSLDFLQDLSDSEILHLCWLVENNLTKKEYGAYSDATYDLHLEIVAKTKKWFWLAMPWQQKVEALAKAKGIEI